MQDCYLAMVKAAPLWNGKSKASTYFWRVCVNTCLDVLKNRKPDTRQLTEANQLKDPDADALMDMVALKARIHSLSGLHREVLEAIIASDYNITKAAALCGLTPTRLRTVAQQAARKIGVVPENEKDN